MLTPSSPPDEVTRLAALHALKVLDTPPEERFDRITRIAQRLFGMPITLISLLDSNRQWFKSRQGLTATQTSRDISFCGHAILGNDPFVVEDAGRDPRFADNPLVTGEPHIRFYAGHPLAGPDGSKLGTLCLIDRRPREMSPADLRVLRDLADLVENQLWATDLNQALARVYEQEARLQDFLDNANDLIQSVTPAGRFTFVNRKWRETLGYTHDDTARLSIFDVIHPDSHGHCAEALQRVLGGEQIDDIEAIFVTKGGRQVMVSGSVNCSFENGQPVTTRGIFRDITERKRAQLELQQLREDFTQLLVHDLRNPLTAIAGTLHLLESSGERLTPERRTRHIANAVRSVHMLNAMISNLLDVDRIEEGKLSLARRPLAPQELIAATAELARPIAEAQQKRITVEVLTRLPSVSGDGELLGRVLSNLVSNALKYTPANGHIRLGARARNEDVEFSVSDEGPGIPAEALGRLFQRFGQVGGGNQRPGTGLGLYFCRLVVEAHGGVIRAESDPSGGSTFRFTLPQGG